MLHSEKYGRTKHFDFSPGVESDDKVISEAEFEFFLNKEVILSEKLDGSNVCLTSTDVFARSHSGPPDHASFSHLIDIHGFLRHKIPKNISVFAEWCLAIHSIKYMMLQHPLNILSVRDDETGKWWSWDEVVMMANELSVPTAPVILRGYFSELAVLKNTVENFSQLSSVYGAEREGIVVRITDPIIQNKECLSGIAKWVRKNHVKTDNHWKHGVWTRQKYLTFI